MRVWERGATSKYKRQDLEDGGDHNDPVDESFQHLAIVGGIHPVVVHTFVGEYPPAGVCLR